MTGKVQIVDGTLFVSYSFLRNLGVSERTISKWSCRKVITILRSGKNSYASYNTIPTPTKLKLPSEETLRKFNSEQTNLDQVNDILEKIEYAYHFQFSQYLTIYQNDAALTTIEKTEAAKLHAVWECLFDMKRKGDRRLSLQHHAFTKLYPNKYSGKTGKHSFANTLKKGIHAGGQSVSVDRKKYGNNRDGNGTRNNDARNYFIVRVVASANKYSVKEAADIVNTALSEVGQSAISESTIKKFRREYLRNPEVYLRRYGQQEANKKMPHASLQQAHYANDQFQIDGWTAPFWGPNFQRYVLVYAIDGYSKKIVGYSIGKSENTTVITESIRDSINNTGVLPFEFLTDNHSFNQTQEAANLQSLIVKKGSRWTVTSNPQYKVVVERYNQYLDNLCKGYFGYLGKGIRSKSIEAHPKPELIDRYSAQFLPENEIKAILVKVVDDYNNQTQKSGYTPSQLYAANPNPTPINVDMFDRAHLLTMQAEKKVLRGQITILRGAVKHEFQLPAHLYALHNDTTVIVRYEELTEGLYLFDKTNGEPIVFLHPKEKINNAKANQTEADQEKLFKNKGRVKGIRSKAVKQLEEITEKAHAVDPEAYQRMNRLTAPKNIMKELEQSAHLRQKVAEIGINTSLIHVPDRQFEATPEALMPVQKKRHSPFAVSDNELKVVDLSQFQEND